MRIPTQERARSDGRGIDPSLGELSGEAAQMQVEAPEHAYPTRREISPPERGAEEPEGPSYYGLPVLKEPVWIGTIPLYFFVGGTAGAAAVLAATAQLLDPKGSRALIRHAHRISAAGDVLGAALLVADLGRPARFLNMLRVFRPTSPMSVGSWVLTASGATSTLAVLPLGRHGWLARVRDAAGYASGLLGLPLAGYTAVLLASTAVPLWQGGRRALPPLFLASSAASAGALLHLLPVGHRGRSMARRFALVGDAATLLLGLALEREVGRVPRAARPLHRGASGSLWSVSRGLTAASLVVAAVGRRRGRRASVIADVLGISGSLALRVAVFTAGKASARDPHATFAQQRGA